MLKTFKTCAGNRYNVKATLAFQVTTHCEQTSDLKAPDSYTVFNTYWVGVSVCRLGEGVHLVVENHARRHLLRPPLTAQRAEKGNYTRRFNHKGF